MQNYHDLSDTQFESVVVALGQHLFGIGLQGFAKGKDGGKDAKFIGTAERYPSKASPWQNCTVIQAKHTNGINASFSDKAFFNPDNQSGVVYEELPRIKALVASGEMQNYLLASNRKLTGITEGKIRKILSDATGLSVENIGLVGSEQLDHWFTTFPQAMHSLNINPLDGPLIVDPDDLAKTIEAFSEVFDDLHVDDSATVPEPRTSYEEKKNAEQYERRIRSTNSRSLPAHDAADSGVSLRSTQRRIQKVVSGGVRRILAQDCRKTTERRPLRRNL